MAYNEFSLEITEGIPNQLPEAKSYDLTVNHAPRRKDVLSAQEKKMALKNALRYFPKKFHSVLAPEFLDELNRFGRIYMYRFRPGYPMFARPVDQYPAQSKQAASIMLMIQNNLDPAVAQHPHELITYGGNGAVFQNWAQYRLTMKYLAEMTDFQTLVMYSGHPLGLFPSHPDAPRVVITNGMMIPNYSSKDDYEKFNALGVTQYGQMTAGSYMYIGPQGIVHGTTITLMNAARLHSKGKMAGKTFVTSGLGGMSGAQPKAAVIAGMIGVVAEINPKALETRAKQGWVDEVFTDLEELIPRIVKAQNKKEAVSLAYLGNVIDLWEKLAEKNVKIDLGSDQTSLHNPFAGGYYPAGLSFEESNRLMTENPELFKEKVYESLRRQVTAIRKMTQNGMYFWDYGNAFLLEARRAGAEITNPDGSFIYPSYVQDIMGPLFFDYGFGPFRWICTSGNPYDLRKTDKIAANVLTKLSKNAPAEIK
jgi:urocanate hydratase